MSPHSRTNLVEAGKKAPPNYDTHSCDPDHNINSSRAAAAGVAFILPSPRSNNSIDNCCFSEQNDDEEARRLTFYKDHPSKTDLNSDGNVSPLKKHPLAHHFGLTRHSSSFYRFSSEDYEGRQNWWVFLCYFAQKRWKFITAGLFVLVLILFTYEITAPSPAPTSGAWDYEDETYHNVQKENMLKVAFLGNSMMYFNDFPRFLQALSADNEHHSPTIYQNSCLHGGASISSLVADGNGMYPQFMTEAAIIHPPDETKYNASSVLYDYGACSVAQLLMGYDATVHEPDYLTPIKVDYADENKTHANMNPCRVDGNYLQYMIHHQHHMQVEWGNDDAVPAWDFVIINDNTKNPAKNSTRNAALQTIRENYIPWFQALGREDPKTIPVFLWTHAYTAGGTMAKLNMTGLDDIAVFTSLTGAGYRAYARLMQQHLRPEQKPRIAPVGLAYLLIHEENFEFWKEHMFHNSDHLHASPFGTFLQGCVVYHTLTGRLPDLEALGIRSQTDINNLWKFARMMQHSWEPSNPLPTFEQIQYLYSIAHRICVQRVIPKTYIHYSHDETAIGVP